MNLKNIYAGYTKDGKDRIFYRIFDEFGSVFIDLKTKERFRFDNIIYETLLPYKIRNKNSMSKRKVIKTFNYDTHHMIHLDNIYIGDEAILVWDNTGYEIINHNVVFVKVDEEEYKKLSNFDEYIEYGSKLLKEGDKCVVNLRKLTREIDSFNYDFASRNNILRKSYKKFRKY